MMDREAVKQMDSRELVGRLLRDVSGLVDKEIELAKADVRETAAVTIRGAVKLAIAAVLLAGALVSLLVTGILALGRLVPDWGAGLIAVAVLGLAAAILLIMGKNELLAVKSRLFRQTRESLREDVEWARHRLTSNGK